MSRVNTHLYTVLDWLTLFKSIITDCDGAIEVAIDFSDTEFYADQIVYMSSCEGRPIDRGVATEIATLMNNLEIICNAPLHDS